MTDWTIAFSPLVPWVAIATVAAIAAVLSGYSLWRRANGAIWRALAFAFLLLALSRPQWMEEDRVPHADVAIALVDMSPSLEIGQRSSQREAALSDLRAAAKRIPNLEWREVRAGTPSEQTPGTHLFDAWRNAVADIPPGRRAGIIVLSDGQVHDQPATDEQTGPVHLLLTGTAGERDRRLQVLQSPRFGIVGEPAQLMVRVDDLGNENGPATAEISVRRNGEEILKTSVATGIPSPIDVPLIRAGANVLDISVADGPDELTRQNNRAVATVNAIRDRLRVLLISGTPYAGERVWRNLLKSDPAVDLVHVTILRPPTKQDATPVEELSLIAFPVRQLFQEKLHEFNLIVFDRYGLRGLISPAYLENIANFARDGGAVLIAVGPSYADQYASLHNSAIGDIMPTQPTFRVREQGFRPTITDIGKRHPVTRDLANTGPWGRWFRQIEATVTGGHVLMTGADGLPLLVLNQLGPGDQKGRVAQFLSDQSWLWARGFEGGGPHSELLRRLAHWLMKEPELGEDALFARAEGKRLIIERNSLDPVPPASQVTGPNNVPVPVALTALGPGRFGAILSNQDDGLYTVEDGANRIVVPISALDARELSDPRASPDPLAGVIEYRAGSVRWLASGTPSLRMVGADQPSYGNQWIGLRRNDAHSVVGLTQRPLLPTWLSLAVSAGLLATGWWREAR